MIATHFKKGIPIGFMSIKFYFCAIHLECATIAILNNGEKATKKRIKQEVMYMLRSGGADGATDWVHEDDFDENLQKARNITQKYFPTFYQTKNDATPTNQ